MTCYQYNIPRSLTAYSSIEALVSHLQVQQPVISNHRITYILFRHQAHQLDIYQYNSLSILSTGITHILFRHPVTYQLFTTVIVHQYQAQDHLHTNPPSGTYSAVYHDNS
jgi:hypothetical protein